MRRVIFRKTYTRDTTLIMQQLWLETQTKGLKRQLGITPKYPLTGVDYLNGGVIEVWERTDAIHWIKEQLIRLSHHQPEKILQLLIQYEKELETLYPLWKKGWVSSKSELRIFLKKIETLTCGDLVFCYLSGQIRTEKKIYSIAKRLRAEDHFFASNDLVLRKSLKRLYPPLSEYVTCIMKKELFGKMPSVHECKRRFHGFVSANNGYNAAGTLAEYRQENKTHVFWEEEISPDALTNGLKGNIAHPGIARGTVRILQRQSQMANVRKGDIIVSPMTTPAFLSALKKAAAIITDEGGVICHAAIVARELKKPCIIGTKVATQVFHDGDRVEVNANSGIVKLL